MIGVTVLGSTGTIGVNTLDVIARHRDRFRVTALTANGDVEGLAEQCRRWLPRYAVMADPDRAQDLRQRLARSYPGVEVLAGREAIFQVASAAETDYVMAAIVGAAGLMPTLAAARAGKRILLANKEALVMSGRILIDAVRQSGAQILPIDSEHNAVFQCLPRGFERGLEDVGVSRILLTASGGPFRKLPLSALRQVTPAQACAHPNWVMGRKISVDCATMMNKGLELIEACWLFNTTPEKVDVVLHPQSVVHSLVEYIDGSVLAQLGHPDMRTPIAHALAWPERIQSGSEGLDLFEVARLDFERPDVARFPCLRLAREAMSLGGTAAAILNAANEVAVAAFLAGELNFADIPAVIETTLSHLPSHEAVSLEVILKADACARQNALQTLKTQVS
ncbi:MAG TPA: 1-deoxy-D-xylulose-5-phosphate reductoisomerase [Gammaproteobacteria bacterium]|nr:1-deoxy-D-xylulose-5-phosphate reductoisomerase [Gammaproteobacteria bacterium]